MPIIQMIVAVLGRALGRVTPAVLAAIGKRLSVAPTSKAIISAVRNNPAVSVLVAAELGPDVLSEITDLYHDWANSSASSKVPKTINAKANVPIDSVTPGLVDSLRSQENEMRAIRVASGVVGGMSNLHALRMALDLSEEHYQLYATLNDRRV